MRPTRAKSSERARELVPSAERPSNLPTLTREGDLLKPITDLILDRRATRHFEPDPVPDELLRAVLALAAQAPSGFNLQPWRFIVVRDGKARRRLHAVVPEHPALLEAPVVVIAVGMKEEFDRHIDAVMREAARRGVEPLEEVNERIRQALDLLATVSRDVWVNRHTMVAVTFMMIAAEAYGFDTLVVESFDSRGLKKAFGVPGEAEVVALLAIGRGKQPDKPYPGRFPLERVIFMERWGQPLDFAPPPAANIDQQSDE